MLNNCKCGAVAKQRLRGSKLFIVCVSSDCSRSSEGDNWDEVQSEWNSQNPSTALSPEDFEKRFEEAIKGITRLLHDNVDDDELLPEFNANFGFDLKEVVREKWAKEHRYDD